ncbi:MAG: bifunctional 3-(3-hydroxy-phenyl)propionate/3-hydroxycinnamic acid hydroxylase [Nitriliruptorales bacterium]|nr:bifunctional 3-(3-hydroxy-phenyl)propionate/3-hydroxycinnamic acid hydroxylase [Nitriliruptorales bacterium]
MTPRPGDGGPAHLPVVVVGGGPVGVTAASLLGAAGVPALVLERERDVYHLPRAAHLDDEVMRIFQSLGVAEEVLVHTRPMASMQVVDANRRVLLRFPRSRHGPYGYPAANMFHQPAVEQVLRTAATERHGVTLRTGSEVARVEQTAGAVRVHARERDTSSEFVMDADFVLACDGARSPIREALGIALRGRRFSQRWLVLDAVVEGGLAGFPHAQQVCDPRRPATYVPMGGPRYRWEFQMLPGERTEDLTDPPVLARLLAPWVERSRVRIDRTASYTFRAVAAERWRVGRIFLLGDAVHQMPPFLGQGLCAGIRDAHNLAWKLALVVAGRADPAVLDTYEGERAPHVAGITRRAVLFGGVMQGGGRGGHGMRWLASRAALGVPGLRRLIERQQVPGLRPGPLLPAAVRGPGMGGRLLPQPVVMLPDGTPTRLDHVLGPGFALIGFGSDPLGDSTPEARADWERLDVLPVTVTPPAAAPHAHAVNDVTGVLTDWAARHRASSVLVRPDRYIFGVAGTHPRAAPSPDHLAVLLRRALRRPAQGEAPPFGSGSFYSAARYTSMKRR